MIVLDLGLPDLSGLDVIRAVRAVLGDADRGAVGPHRQQRQGGRPRSRRRRLRDQAVQHRGTARPAARRDPARAGASNRPWPCRSAPTRSTSAPRPSPTPPANAVHLTPTEWHLLEALVRRPGQPGHRRRRCSPSCAAAPEHTDPQLPAHLHGRSCGASSNPNPAGRATSSPSPAWVTASSPELSVAGALERHLPGLEGRPQHLLVELADRSSWVPRHERPVLRDLPATPPCRRGTRPAAPV